MNKQNQYLKVNGMDMLDVSIIIPVYNVENYLRQCLDSVVNQTLEKIEIICVNDGSTDSSLQILEEYARNDDRVKIINKENNGAGAARKTGLDNAKGEFIAFVDSDDWVKLDTYENLYKNAISNNSDLVMLNFDFYDEFKDEYTSWPDYNIAKYFNEDIDFYEFIFHHSDIKPHLLNRSFSPWSKLYKTEFIRSYDDFYLEKFISLGEDVPFHVQVLLRARRISFYNDRCYFYRISNVDSICNSSVRSKKVFDIFTIVDEVENILINSKKMDEYRNEFFIFQLTQIMHWFQRCEKNVKEEFFEVMKQFFSKINFEINNSYLYSKDDYEDIMSSDCYKEYELIRKIKKLETSNKNRLTTQKQAYENELELQKQVYEKKLDVKERIIRDINSSNSWKLTKPLRKFGTEIKRIKNRFNEQPTLVKQNEEF